MRCAIVVMLAAISMVSLVSSYPVQDERGFRSEALDRLLMVEADKEAALRSKRTIGILRQLFPGISQMIEQKVNGIVGEIIRALGPIILRNVLGNNNGGGGGSNGDRKSNEGSIVTLADEDQENTNDVDDETGARFNSMSSNGSRVSISLPTFPPDEDEDTEAQDTSTPTTASDSGTNATATTTDSDTSTVTNTTTDSGTSTATITSSQSTTATTIESTTGSNTSDVNPEAEDRVNEVGAESQNNEVRVQFADEQAANEATPELTPLEDVESSDDENRNKRFLNFGLGASAGTGGSGAGSGNFLFDIIRQAADGAARAAGTVYRVVAGTQSLGLGLSASRDVAAAAGPAAAPAAASSSSSSSSSAPGASSTADASSTAAPEPGAGTQPPLVAGSGGQQSNSSGGASAGRTDGTQEAIPGPITRLFVIANRGISNLVQDLILRLAATSERIVNFKARLITSII